MVTDAWLWFGDASLSMKYTVFFVLSLIVTIGGLSVAVFLGYRSYQESKRHDRIAEEIRSLQEEADRIHQDNRRLSDRIEYLQSDSFREGEAKRTLDYHLPDEKVIVIDDATPLAGEPSSEITVSKVDTESSAKAEEPNYQKWWNIFFGT